MVRKHVVKERCFINNWLLSRAPPLFAWSVELWKQSSDQMGCVYIKGAHVQRAHCAPSKASYWAYKKIRETPFTHTRERKSQVMCTAAFASKGALEILCAAVKAWRAEQVGRKPQKHSKDSEPIPILGASDIVMSAKLMGCYHPRIWCPGVFWHLQAQCGTSGGGCKWATCLECCTDAHVARDTWSRGWCHHNVDVKALKIYLDRGNLLPKKGTINIELNKNIFPLHSLCMHHPCQTYPGASTQKCVQQSLS